MVFVLRDQIQGHQPIADNSTTQRHPLGLVVAADDDDYGGGVFIYLKGVASTAVGSLVLYNPDDFSTSLATADDKGSLAIAMSACVASEFGWYQIAGKGSVKALAGFVDDADCYLTATAGSIDDAVVAGDLIYKMKGASAVSGGLADVEIDYPYVLDGDVLDSTAVTASGTELNYLAGITPGTQAASKAVVADSNVNTGVSKVTELHIGSSGSEVQVNATPAEIDRVADVSARIVSLSGTESITQASHDGKTLSMGTTDVNATLPAATGTGARFRFLVTGVPATTAHTIACAGTDEFNGHVLQTDTDTSDTLASYPALAGDDFDLITLDGTTKGGIVGDWIEVEDIASGVWALKAITNASGSVASPLSSS